MIEAKVTRYTWGFGEEVEIHAEAKPQRDGSILWRVGNRFGCWTRERIGICWETRPSNRDEDFFRDFRWSFDEAMVEGPKALAFMQKQDADARGEE